MSRAGRFQYEILKKQKTKIETLEKTILVLEEEIKKYKERDSKMSFMLKEKLK